MDLESARGAAIPLSLEALALWRSGKHFGLRPSARVQHLDRWQDCRLALLGSCFGFASFGLSLPQSAMLSVCISHPHMAKDWVTLQQKGANSDAALQAGCSHPMSPVESTDV